MIPRTKLKNKAFFSKDTSDFGECASQSLKKILRNARMSGILNLSNQNLNEIPESVYTVNEIIDEDEKFWEINILCRLDLSFNNITNINPQISNLKDIVFLKLRNNKLQSVVEDIYDLRLKHLDLSSNLIESISPSIGKLNEVKEILLFSNRITTLPQEIYKCQSLQILELNDNLLISIPDGLFQIKSLLNITLTNNNLSILPSNIGNMRNIQLLEIRRNKLLDIPDMSELNSLTFIDLGENKISKMPILPKNGKLTRLHLNANQLYDLHPLHHLLNSSSTLTELHLQNNKFDILPVEIAYLYNLKVLDISNNNISDIPPPIGYMKSLQRMILDGNPLRAIRRALGTSISTTNSNSTNNNKSTVELKRYLRTRGSPLEGMILGDVEEIEIPIDNEEMSVTAQDQFLEGKIRDCYSCGGCIDLSTTKNISNTPNFVLKLSQSSILTSLILSKCDLFSLPNLSSLINLKSLDVSSNQLGKSDPELFIGILPPSLLDLNISGNRFSDQHLDSLISQYQYQHTPTTPSCLSTLIASNNNLICLPSSIQYLISLREAQFASNQIQDLDSIDWSQMIHLENLDLKGNKLTVHKISRLYVAISLTSLSLDNNELKEIPPELCLLINLRYLGLYGNPQRSITTHILQQGTDAILRILRNRYSTSLSTSTSTTIPKTTEIKTINKSKASVQEKNTISSDPKLTSSISKIPTKSNPKTIAITKMNSIQEAKDNKYHQTFSSKNSDEYSSIPIHADSKELCISEKRVEVDSSATVIAIEKLKLEKESLERQLETSISISETKRFAMKKDIAILRANILRLNRKME